MISRAVPINKNYITYVMGEPAQPIRLRLKLFAECNYPPLLPCLPVFRIIPILNLNRVVLLRGRVVVLQEVVDG
jgi:hypothetical protein